MLFSPCALRNLQTVSMAGLIVAFLSCFPLTHLPFPRVRKDNLAYKLLMRCMICLQLTEKYSNRQLPSWTFCIPMAMWLVANITASLWLSRVALVALFCVTNMYRYLPWLPTATNGTTIYHPENLGFCNFSYIWFMYIFSLVIILFLPSWFTLVALIATSYHRLPLTRIV